MPEKKEPKNYFITEEARRRFRRYLADENLSFAAFCRKTGATRQYLERVLKGELRCTEKAREYFKKGGYDLL